MTARTEPNHRYIDPATLERIVTAVTGLRYGSVEITVHDARVVQIERRERIRYPEEKLDTERRSTG